MPLLERIQNDLKSAIKNKSEKELSALRMLVAAVKNEEISKRPKALEESDIAIVVKREIKKLKDGIEQFLAGGREDLARQYEEEANLFSKYLPEMASEEDIRRAVKNALQNGEAKNFGAVIKAAMAELNGNADGALVSRIVKQEMGQ